MITAIANAGACHSAHCLVQNDGAFLNLASGLRLATHRLLVPEAVKLLEATTSVSNSSTHFCCERFASQPKRLRFQLTKSTAHSIPNLRAYQGGLWERSLPTMFSLDNSASRTAVPVEVRLGCAAHRTLDKIYGLRSSDRYMEHRRWLVNYRAGGGERG